MKELSIEEKARRYDEAIKKVNDYYEGKTKLYSDVDKTLDYLFPALKESEDEKIRKALVKHCREQLDIYKTLQTAKEYGEIQSWITWLEKHKYTEEDLDKAYKCADEVQYRRGYEDAKKELENQGEQKESLCDKCRKEQPSASCQDITALGRCALEHQGKQKLQSKSALEVWKDMRLEVYAQASGNRHEPNCSDDKTKMFSLSDIDEIIEKISEQKPSDKIEQEYHCTGVREPKEATGVLKQLLNKENYAWSEEDEAYRVDILVKLEPHITDDNFTDVQNWFKSIKGRVQPKQEWSKEDVCNIQDIDSVLFYDKSLPEDTCKRLRNWLKSLKDRYTWKPSEEQMDALETATSSLQSTTLESLYQDLKKL